MKNNFKISPYGNMLVYQKGYTSAYVKELIAEHHLDGLRIFDDLEPLDSLDFLADYTFLRKLHIGCIHDQDYSFLKKLHHLEDVSIQISTSDKNPIDLSAQIELKNLWLHWRKGKILGLNNCKKLKDLRISEFNEKNLTVLPNFTDLEFLSIKTSSIQSLEGLAGMSNLKSIILGNCRKLQDISSISEARKLVALELNKCPSVRNLDALSALKDLEKLQLVNMSHIESIQVVKNLTKLQSLGLIENTNVLDGDLSPARGIAQVSSRNREHYNMKFG